MTKLKFLKVRVIAERPTKVNAEGMQVDIPSDALIFNAPRPIFASCVDSVRCAWKGDFLSGVFWTAVMPSDQFFASWVRGNADQKAVLVEFVTAEQARAEIMAWYVSFGQSEDEIRQSLSTIYSAEEMDEIFLGDWRANLNRCEAEVEIE